MSEPPSILSVGEETPVGVPILAVVGRPNVGKSTLVNRILGRREAVVEDVPGVTRDRVSYDASWNGRAFTVVDTGGWNPDARGLAERIAAQAEVAVGLADAVLFVVDATVGITDADEAVVKILRSSKKPVILAANKVDDMRAEAEAYGLWNLGLGEPYAVSALHGRGSGDLLDAVLAALPETPEATYGEVGGPRRVAIVGKPNVGKSSLLNRLAGEERVVVDNVAGTTVDPVDELVELGDQVWRFIDTAGIRKRVKEASGHEYYASLRTTTAIDRAEVAVLVVDAREPLSEQDVRILQTVRDAGRALVIAFNKWDLVDEERRYYLQREIERDLVQVQWAPRINVTARTGWHVDRWRRLSSERWRAGRRGSAPARSTRSWGGWWPNTPTPSGAASSPRSSSAPRCRPDRPCSCSSPAASWRRPTFASSSAASARSTASSVRRSSCSRSPGRSESADALGAVEPVETLPRRRSVEPVETKPYGRSSLSRPTAGEAVEPVETLYSRPCIRTRVRVELLHEPTPH